MTNKSKYFITIMFLAFIGVFAILFWVVPKSDFSQKAKVINYLTNPKSLKG